MSISDLIRNLQREISYKGLVCPREYIVEAISYLKEYEKIIDNYKSEKEDGSSKNV